MTFNLENDKQRFLIDYKHIGASKDCCNFINSSSRITDSKHFGIFLPNHKMTNEAFMHSFQCPSWSNGFGARLRS
jgi:hypothetical protein